MPTYLYTIIHTVFGSAYNLFSIRVLAVGLFSDRANPVSARRVILRDLNAKNRKTLLTVLENSSNEPPPPIRPGRRTNTEYPVPDTPRVAGT